MKRSLVVACVVAAWTVAVAACGGSEKVSVATVTSPSDVTVPSAGATTATTAVTTPSATVGATATSSVGPSSTPAPSTPPAASDHQCPSDEAISTAAGVPMHFDHGDVQAAGFCPYKSDDENVTVSVTFTPMNMTSFQDATQTEVPGLGQKALWADGSDELVVWLGNGSIIVSVLTFGQQGFDHLGFATKVAQTVIGA